MIALLRAPAAWPLRAGLAALFAVAWPLVGAWRDAPWIDDWVYAWSVEHLLTTGRLDVLPYSAIYPLGQVAWAAPFAWVMGFSFVSLRLATVVLAVFGAWAVVDTVVDIGVSRRSGLLAAAALVAHPVYFAMSFSFMTEVPFVAISSLALSWYVRAAVRDDVRASWLAGAFATWAFLVRPIGLLVPLAALSVLCLPLRPRWRGHALSIATVLAVMVGLQLLLPQWLGPLDWADVRSGYLAWWFTVPLAHYVAWTVEVIVQAAFPLAPLLVIAALATGRWRAAAAAAVALPVVAWTLGGEVPSPMPHGQMWSLEEISARAMLPGGVPGHPWALDAQPWLMALGALVAGAALTVMVPPRRERPMSRATARGVALVGVYGVLQLGAIHVLWLYNDRYYLVLAPVLAILGARVLDGRPRAQAVAACALVPWLAIAVTGTRDMLAVNHVAAAAVRALEASGVPAFQIDAGYTLNGWRLYAHPEHLPAGVDRATGVPRVTSNTTPPGAYVVTTSPRPGETVVQTLPLPAVTWQSSTALYLVRR